MSPRETYPKSHTRILAALKALGWHTTPTLKTPWADNGTVRVWFHAQAVYAGPSGAPHGAARSLWLDTRGMPLEAFLKAVEAPR